MLNETFKSINEDIKHWYLPLIIGIIFLIIGIWAIITPEATYLSLAMLFSVTFFAQVFLKLFIQSPKIINLIII